VDVFKSNFSQIRVILKDWFHDVNTCPIFIKKNCSVCCIFGELTHSPTHPPTHPPTSRDRFLLQKLNGRSATKEINVKVKLSLCFFFLTEHHATKAYWMSEGLALYTFLTSAVDGGKCSASRPGYFTPRERAPVTHWIGGWVGPRAGLDVVVKRKSPSPFRDSNPPKYKVKQKLITCSVISLLLITSVNNRSVTS
jgi:hypothetical protein